MAAVVVTTLTQTCPSCPAQWEGRTTDGAYVYVRYRWGHLQVGFGATMDDAVKAETIYRRLGDDYDGSLTYPALMAACPEVGWPLSDTEHT